MTKLPDAEPDVIESWQRAVQPGEHCLRAVPLGALLLYTYCEVLPDDEADRDPDYVFVRSHHVQCPEGEEGDAHRSSLVAPLTSAQFAVARHAGWPNDPLRVRILYNKVAGGQA